MQFNEFINHRQREDREHLALLARVLKSGNDKFEIKTFFDDDDPYIYIKSPYETFSFEGIRVYPRGDTFAYKVQNEEDTHPYGKAYSLDLERMFSDFMGDNLEAEDAAKRVMLSAKREIRTFFKKTEEAEEKISDSPAKSQYLLKTGGAGDLSAPQDYSTMVTGKV